MYTDFTNLPQDWTDTWKFSDVNSTEGAAGTTRKAVWINSDTTTNPVFQISRAHSFFGIRPAEDGPNRGVEIDAGDELAHFVQGIEAKIKQVALERSTEWFGREKTAVEIDAMFSSPLSENEKYATRLKLKVTPKTRIERIVAVTPQSGLQEMLYTTASPDDISPKTDFYAVAVRLSKVWFMGRDAFGVIFALDRVMIDATSKKPLPPAETFYFGAPAVSTPA